MCVFVFVCYVRACVCVRTCVRVCGVFKEKLNIKVNHSLWTKDTIVGYGTFFEAGLKFSASNGIVCNAEKTSQMMKNGKDVIIQMRSGTIEFQVRVARPGP